MMKKKIQMYVLCSLMTSGLFASPLPDGDSYKETVAGIEWTFKVKGGKATVQSVPTGISGEVTVPSELGGNPVTSIGEYAFGRCSSSTPLSISIPSGVSSIEHHAFYQCWSLTSISLPSGLTSIGGGAFRECSRLSSINIPASVTSVGACAFYACPKLGDGVVIIDDCVLTVNGVCPSSVALPQGTRLIAGAFFHCSNLTSINIPSSVIGIESGSFECCTSLTAIEIPSNVTSIGDEAFWECKSLTSVNIPSSVTNIGERAFYCCTKLTSVSIPSSVTSVGCEAFAHCIGLTSVSVPSTVKKIERGMFNDCRSLTSVNISSGATSIGEYAFKDCGSLTTIEIPSGVTSIGHEAFRGCTNLTSVTIPSSVTSLASWTFYGCSSLTSINIPSGVTNIGGWMFYGCSSLTSIAIPSSVTSIGPHAFQGCMGLGDGVVVIDDCVLMVNGVCPSSVALPQNVRLIASCAFEYCSNLTSVAMTSGVSSIGGGAFQGCTMLTSVNLPSTITNLEESAFRGCCGLAAIDIPSGVTSIGYRAFENCVGLTSVNIFSGVTSIGYEAFRGCTNLTSISIPSSVTSIGSQAFQGCTGLGDGVVMVDGCVLTVNGECPSSVVLPANIRLIASWAFANCSSLTSISIPSGVTSIGDGTFLRCTGLTEINIPMSVTSIGMDAFYGCVGLGDGVVVIDDCVLTVNGECPSWVILSQGTRLIASCAFVDGWRLASVGIPSSVTSIGEGAFMMCGDLTSVDFEGAPAFGLSSAGIRQNARIRYNCVYESEWLPVIEQCGFTNASSFDPVSLEGPYQEEVDGIAWNYYRNFYGAYVGGEDGAIDSDVMGAIEIPAMLGERSVINVSEDAFALCGELTSVTIPASVMVIEDGAFYKCAKLDQIVFRGDEPAATEDAFYKVKTTCGIKVTHGTTWSVDIPGTWNGLSIAYLPWCDESLNVMPSLTNGSTFVLSAQLELTASSGCEIRYTTDGSEPTKQSALYSSPINVAATTTIKYIAIETATQNWSPVGAVTLTRVPGETETLVVTPNVVSGMTFVGSGTVSLSVDGGTVIYYTDDGSDPRTSGSRVQYLDEVQLTESKTLKFYGLNSFGDYGPVGTASYIVQRADGGPYVEIVGGIAWTFMVTNGEAVVTSVPKDTSGRVVIPSELGGRTVTSVGDHALYKCRRITSVVMPSSISNVQDSAFADCTMVKRVEFEGTPSSDWVNAVPGAWANIYYNEKYSTEWESALSSAGIEDGIPYDPALGIGTEPIVSVANLTVTNVVVQYVLNSIQPEIAVPVSGDTGFVAVITEVKSTGVVSVPSEWKDNYSGFTAKYGSDFVKALMKKSGKKDGAGNDMLVWQDYVAGTDPTDEDDVFTASVTMVDGAPVISYTPELNDAEKALRVYKTWGKVKLQDADWIEVPDGHNADYNFFKVTVEMK